MRCIWRPVDGPSGSLIDIWSLLRGGTFDDSLVFGTSFKPKLRTPFIAYCRLFDGLPGSLIDTWSLLNGGTSGDGLVIGTGFYDDPSCRIFDLHFLFSGAISDGGLVVGIRFKPKFGLQPNCRCYSEVRACAADPVR
mmetsp:Transcript_79810/g.247602  ORF Transcript_79810/g.247602 Transcript_79810/m.247602 type:complete len:137 (-) Transcript_79810:357-767(-)